MIGLTKRQAAARDYIAAENAQGRWPTFRQVSAAIGCRSSGTGHAVIHQLSERGHVYQFLTPKQAAEGKTGRLIVMARRA